MVSTDAPSKSWETSRVRCLTPYESTLEPGDLIAQPHEEGV